MSLRCSQTTAAGRSGTTAAYAYDPEDRRTKKTVNGVVTRMLWSGAEELAQLDASGAVLRRFVPGPAGMDDRIAYVEANGTVTWPHTDRLGSVVAVSNGAGQATDVTGYSPWGEMPAGRTLPPGGVFGYTGRERDAETGLWQYRARYYHERGGFFLSTDPVGTKDDPNLYMYVGLDPVNKADPTGNIEIFIGGGFDKFTHVMRDYADRYKKDHPDRDVRYYHWSDRDLVRETIDAYSLSDEPVNIIGHSWGGSAAGGAAEEAYGRVTNLITIDPVGRFENMGGDKPANVGNWLNVDAAPILPNRDDIIAAIGGKPSALPTAKADKSVSVEANHGDVTTMMRKSGAEKLIDDSYKTAPK